MYIKQKQLVKINYIAFFHKGSLSIKQELQSKIDKYFKRNTAQQKNIKIILKIFLPPLD